MDLWPPTTELASSTTQPVHHSRILTSTSGNAQTSLTSNKACFDNKEAIVDDGQPIAKLQRSSPVPTLTSNDKSTLHRRLAAHKARRSTHPGNERAYLKAPNYKVYRGRKRQDKGKDGQPVWPDHIEEAFQNAIVHIPPMGRRKKTQYGRPRGRNELIAEWIFQETGEIRDRKQISSHIQVLNGRLKDMPEWRKLTAPPKEENDNENDNPGGGFYYESIADQVRLQRQLAQTDDAGKTQVSWLKTHFRPHSLSRLSFELWVGAPENITQALHNYTRVPNNHSPLPSVPIDDFDNWRDLFPDLEQTLQSGIDTQPDIILVRSSFALMSDFPPKTSKLGLVLDLDFRNPDRDTIKALSELKFWSSVNHIYLGGRTIRRTEHKECQSAEFGLVKPFFEADWWASQFTKLTHKRKEAESSHDGYTISSADEHSRSLFRRLSIMQEVLASPFSEELPGMPRKRMAILLWVFTQANKGQAGITSWQKVNPPLPREALMSTHSPTVVGSTLPPFVLDSMVENSFDTSMMEDDFTHHGAEANVTLSPSLFASNTYHSGFTPIQNMNHEQLKFYDFTSTGFTPRLNDYGNHKDDLLFGFDTATSSTQQNLSYQPSAAAFDQLSSEHNSALGFTNAQAFHARDTAEASIPDRRQCLANFDVSTHQMLQAQLGDAQLEVEHSSQDDYSVLRAESQISVTNHMNNLELKIEDTGEAFIGHSSSTATSTIDIMDHGQTALCHPSAFESPKVARPPLLPHNSFAGVLRTMTDVNESLHEQLGFDTPTRHDFVRLMENHYVNADDDIFAAGNVRDTDHRALVDGNNILRPRSQPVLPSNVSLTAFGDDNIFLDDVDDQTHIKIEPEN